MPLESALAPLWVPVNRMVVPPRGSLEAASRMEATRVFWALDK